MRLALYCRVSTSDQTCEMQLRELRQYAAARGWPIIAEFVDTGVSGAKTSRPQLDLMLAAAKRRDFDIIAVYKLDRLGRSLSHLIATIGDFGSWGVRFIAISQGIDTDANNPTSRLLLGMLAVLAEFERELIRERISSGVRNARANGKEFGRRRVVFDRQRARDLLNQPKATYRSVARELGVSLSVLHGGMKSGAHNCPIPAESPKDCPNA